MRPNRLLWLLFTLYLTFMGGASYYNTIFAVKVAHHVLLTVIMALWLVQKIRKNQGFPRTGLTLPLVGLVVVVGINIVFSIDPRMSFEHAWFMVVHLVLFLMIVDLLQRGYQRLVMELVFFMATIAVLISLWELAAWYFGTGIIPNTDVGFINTGQGLIPSLSSLPRLYLAMSVSTLLAGYIAPLITVSLGWALTTMKRDYKIVLLLLMALLILVLVMTGSRGGLLGLGVALGAFAVCQLIRSPRVTRVISARILIATSTVVGIVAALGFVILTLPRGIGTSNEGRVDMWRSAIEITADYPVFGVGYGMFGRAFRNYRDPEIVQDKLAHAHNLYLNTLSELGVAGAVVIVWLGGATILVIWRNYRTQTDRRKQMRIEAVCCALLGYGAHSLVEAFSITPIILMVITLIAYAITPLPQSRVVTLQKGHRNLAIGLLVIVVAWGMAQLLFDAAQNQYMQAFRQQTVADALQNVQAAKALDPNLGLYDLSIAYLVAQDAIHSNDAIDAYDNALAIAPTWEIGWANLAASYADDLDFANAFAAMNKAYALNHNTPMLVWWARFADVSKAIPDADIVTSYIRAMDNAFTIKRVLPLSTFWQETDLSKQALEEFAIAIPLDWQYRIWRVQDPSWLPALIPTNPQTYSEWWIMGETAFEAGNIQVALDAFDKSIALLPSADLRGDFEASRARALLALNAPMVDIELAIKRAKFYGVWLEEIPKLTPESEDSALIQRTSINAIEFAAVLYGRPPLFDYDERLAYPDR